MWKGPSGHPHTPLGGRVLELGCGNGKTAAALVRHADLVVGLDFSRSGLLSCRASVHSPRLELVEADVRALPFPHHVFDHVVAVHVLGHLLKEERRNALSEIRRVTAPGGTVIIRAFSQRDLRAGKGQEVEPGTFMKGNGIPTHFFSRQELVDLMTGLEMLSLEEVVQGKRYGGVEHDRAEWCGTFQTVGPMR